MPRHPHRAARGSTLVSLLVLTLLPVLPGCISYHYDGETYPTQSRAFWVQERQHKTSLARIQPLPQPLAESARIGIPDDATIRERAIIGGGAGRDFVAEILKRDFAHTAKAIERRNLFRRVVVEATHGEDLEPRSGEVVIYIYMPSTKAAGWYFKSYGNRRTPIFFEHGQSELHARTAYFLGSIERLLAPDSGSDPTLDRSGTARR